MVGQAHGIISYYQECTQLQYVLQNSGEKGMMEMISKGHSAFSRVCLKEKEQMRKLLDDDILPASEWLPSLFP